MQTFLPYADFEKTAKCLDYKRLGKQRVEAWQIYLTLEKGEYSICPKCKGQGTLWQQTPFNGHYSNVNMCKKCKGSGDIKTSWYNHPIVKMWKRYEQALLKYGIEICKEWINRNYKDTMLRRFIDEYYNYCKKNNLYINRIKYPKWFGNKKFHASHRSNLLRKDKNYYSKFGWKESNDLPYIWITK